MFSKIRRRWWRRWTVLCAISISAVASSVAMAAEPAAADKAVAEKAIRAAATAFVEAFNRGNAAEVAAHWTMDGSLADDQGLRLKGRAAIEAKYAEYFKAQPGAKMEVTVTSIEFPTATIAVEDGVARIVSERVGPPSAGRYTAVHTLDNGKWLMASVRESTIDVPSNFARLEPLQGLIGKWQAKADGVTLESEIHWIANKSFMQRDYRTLSGGSTTATGTQIIGWDATSGQIRSWSFDSSGGYGSGLWTATPDGWQIQSAGVLADGTPTSSLDSVIVVRGEPNVFGWRSSQRRLGDVALPNTPEVVFDRAAK